MAKLLILILLISIISLSMSNYSGDKRISELCGTKMCSVLRIDDPTCGSDGKVYVNWSAFDCINKCLPPEEEVKKADPSLCEPELTNIHKARKLRRM